MNALRILLCSALLVLPIAALSRAPYTPPRSADALLRLSWRMSVTAKENCRPRTQAELDELPVHMRTSDVCTRDRAGYVLITRIGEEGADTMQLVRGGAMGDRPLFVLEERALAPGRHRVRLALERTSESTGTEVLAAIDTTLALAAGRVQLVTLGDGGRHFTARTSR